MEDFRKLLVLGVNEALRQKRIGLELPVNDAPTDEDGHLIAVLAGFNSVINWSSISVGELRVSVWWCYDHSQHPQANSLGNAKEQFSLSRPLAKQTYYPRFVGATASGWLERKTSKHLQGIGKQGIFDTYLRRDMKDVIRSLQAPVPEGYSAEGAFFM